MCIFWLNMKSIDCFSIFEYFSSLEEFSHSSWARINKTMFMEIIFAFVNKSKLIFERKIRSLIDESVAQLKMRLNNFFLSLLSYHKEWICVIFFRVRILSLFRKWHTNLRLTPTERVNCQTMKLPFKNDLQINKLIWVSPRVESVERV